MGGKAGGINEKLENTSTSRKMSNFIEFGIELKPQNQFRPIAFSKRYEMLDEIETTVWNFNKFLLQKHAKFLNIALLCVRENSEFSDIIQVICKILMYK